MEHNYGIWITWAAKKNFTFSSYFDGNLRSLEEASLMREYDRKEYSSVSQQSPSLRKGSQFRDNSFHIE